MASSRVWSVLYVGSGEGVEFRGPRALLESTAAVATARTVAEACSLLHAGHFLPDLILLEQSRPQEPQGVERLKSAAPLAGLWALVGSWAEGEDRTGRPSPLARRIPWRNFAATWHSEIARAARNEPASWELPLTTTPEERLLASCDEAPQLRFPLHVAIYSDRRDVSAWLCDACRSAGASVIVSGLHAPAQVPDARLALVQFDAWTPETRNAWRKIERCVPAARKALLLGFPRWQDVEEAERQEAERKGAEAVYALPCSLAILWQELTLAASEAESALNKNTEVHAPLARAWTSDR